MNDYIDRVIARLKRGWTRMAYARNAADESVLLHDASACKWCVSGAMALEHGPDVLEGWYLEQRLRTRFMNKCGSMPADYNDFKAIFVEDVISILEKCKDAA